MCTRCGGKGYIEDVSCRNGGQWNLLRQCCDISAYSRAVADRKAALENSTGAKTPPPPKRGPHLADVIELNARRDHKS